MILINNRLMALGHKSIHEPSPDDLVVSKGFVAPK